LNLKFKVASFYQFKNIPHITDLHISLKKFCEINKLLGTILIAPEGINGTLAGLPDSVDKFINYAKTLEFACLNIKYSESTQMPFYRIKIKIKSEIISFHKAPVKFTPQKGISIDPDKWNELIEQPDVVTIDVRNQFETEIGNFDNAIDPKTQSFVEFKKYIDTELINDKDQKIAMYCTGGIRCEKASKYMKSIGFKNIYLLNGGILKYLEHLSNHESAWNGECFVFDNRVAVTHDLNQGSYEICHGCNNPISGSDKLSDKFEKDVSCPNCYDLSTDIKKNSSRERSKQINLARERKTHNVYIPTLIEDY